MSAPESQSSDSLTGVWEGVFRQAGHGSVAFTATLIDSDGQISGATHEACTQVGCPRRMHIALLSGGRQGRAVSFVKTYDPPGFGYDTVSYAGELNGDASEIAGAWTIGGAFSGDFVMVRARRRAVARRRRKLATA